MKVVLKTGLISFAVATFCAASIIGAAPVSAE